MSFIAVTYGYQMYSVFNINCTTYPLIDEIKETIFKNIKEVLSIKLLKLENEIKKLKADEENTLKQLEKLKIDKDNEESKIKINLIENTKKSSDILKKDNKNKNTNKAKEASSIQNDEDLVLNKIIEDINKNKNTISYIESCKAKYLNKVKQLEDKIHYFKNLDYLKLSIDLCDGYNNKVDINNKENSEASKYLTDKQCYELLIKNTGIIIN